MIRLRPVAGAAILISCASCVDDFRFYSLRTDAGDSGSVDVQSESGVDTGVDAPDVTVSRCTSPITDLRAFEGATCARRANGALHCWGRNVLADTGAPGFGVLRRLSQNATDVVIGVSSQKPSVCFIEGGLVKCAGNNERGQLGQPPSATPVSLASAVTVPGVSDARALSGGLAHVCALTGMVGTATQQVTCWGHAIENRTGRAGMPTEDQAMWGTPIALPITAMPRDEFQTVLSAGTTNYLVIQRSGATQLVGWGRNQSNATFPSPITLDSNVFPSDRIDQSTLPTVFTDFLVSPALVCAVDPDAIRCIGTRRSGVFGQMDPSSFSNWTSLGTMGPIARGARGLLATAGGLDVEARSLMNGATFVCAVFSSTPNRVFCRGSNSYGQLGTSTAVTSAAWVNIGLELGADNITHLAAGAVHACVRTQSDQVYCWGRSACGERGAPLNGNNDACSSAMPMRPDATEILPNRVEVPCE